MKKLFTVVAACLLCAGVFAAEDCAEVSAYVGLSFPQIYNLRTSRINEEGKKADSEKYAAIGFDFGGRVWLADNSFGVFTDIDLYMPYRYQVTWGNTTDSYSLSGSNSFWGIEGTIGPYWVLLNSGLLVIPVGAGVHINYIKNTSEVSSDMEVSSSALALGAGAFINAELNLQKGMSVFASLHLNYDVWEKNTYKTSIKTGTNSKRSTSESDSSGISQLMVEPVFGVIWRF